MQAWVCGSGLGTDERRRDGAARACSAAPVPVVLDADALTLLVDGSHGRPAARPRRADWCSPRTTGEFARLAGERAGRRPGRRRRCQLAARINAVVLLKGDRTIVATPDGRAWANPTGTPALATGGTGDVLAGLLGSLLAAGLPPERAAVAAAYVHGLAGRRAAERPARPGDDRARRGRRALRSGGWSDA